MQAQIPTVERNWAMAAHLSALVAAAGLPFGHVLGPLIVYLAKGHESAFVAQHARASLNYQLTISILAIVAIVVALAGVAEVAVAGGPNWDSGATVGAGVLALWIAVAAMILIIAVASLVFIVLGTLAASEGRPYTYPFAIRFLR